MKVADKIKMYGEQCRKAGMLHDGDDTWSTSTIRIWIYSHGRNVFCRASRNGAQSLATTPQEAVAELLQFERTVDNAKRENGLALFRRLGDE